MNFLNRNKYKIIIFLIIISIFSFSDTLWKGFINGCDFQWQPSVLFWDGVNHYEKFINNGKSDFLCQGGEYGHLLHVVLYPYTLFEWETARFLWVITNVIFAFVIPILFCKKLKLSNYKTIILLLIFITCYPTRMTINYGQQSLFVLFFICLPFIYKSNLAIFFSGLSSVKYSTGYVLFINFLIRKEFKKLFLASIPYLLGWIIYFSYTDSNPIVNFFEPIEWSLQKNYIRDGDIYSLLQIYFINDANIFFKYLTILLIFLFNIFFIIKIQTLSDNFLKMSLVLICPLIFFPHSNYDYVLLFPLACYSLFNFHKLINKFNFFFIIYFYYFSRIIKHLFQQDWIYQPLLLVVMIMVIFLNLRFNIEESKG